MITQEPSTQMKSLILIFLSEAFRASPFQPQDEDWRLRMKEELCSLNLPEYLKQNVLHFSSLKTFPLSERFKRGRFLRSSSAKYLDWGMCANGSVLTARLTFPKAESGCSLSDILIPDVPEKYYLSKEKAQRLFPNSPTELHRVTESMMQKAQP